MVSLLSKGRQGPPTVTVTPWRSEITEVTEVTEVTEKGIAVEF
jgi:hypothetical protein